MKETRRYKRFDLLSTLSILGILSVSIFQCFFVFELYNRDIAFLERFLPATKEAAPIEEPAPVG